MEQFTIGGLTAKNEVKKGQRFISVEGTSHSASGDTDLRNYGW